MVKLGAEIPSYRRAAENFSDLTKVGVSKRRLGELVKFYGGKIVEQQEAEATAMVADGSVPVLVDSVYGFDDYREALAHLRSGGQLGKVVLGR